jgi:hypothetical protein
MQTFVRELKPLRPAAPEKQSPQHHPRRLSPSILPLTFSQIPLHSPIKRDSTEEAPTPAAPEAATKTPDAQSATSGSDPDVITPPGEGRTTAPETETDEKADKDVPVVANIRLNPNPVAPTSTGGSKTDSVVSSVTPGALQRPSGGTLGPTEFGTESFEPTFTGVSHAFAGGKCTITATFNPICPWITQSRGRTDVPSATDAVVTKDNWPDIKSDLAPRTTTPFKSPRTHFYSQSLVERHEKFHGTDDYGWVNSSGLGIIKTNLEAGNIANSEPAATTGIASLLEATRLKVVDENFKWYKGTGTAHDSFAGEIRAYADGKPEYQKLADDVETQGKKLATPPPAAPPHGP